MKRGGGAVSGGGAIGAPLSLSPHLCLRRQGRVRVQQPRQAGVGQQVSHPGARVKGRRVQGGGRAGGRGGGGDRRAGIGSGGRGRATAAAGPAPAGAGPAADAALLVITAQQGAHAAGPLVGGLGGGGGGERESRPSTRAGAEGRGGRGPGSHFFCFLPARGQRARGWGTGTRRVDEGRKWGGGGEAGACRPGCPARAWENGKVRGGLGARAARPPQPLSMRRKTN